MKKYIITIAIISMLVPVTAGAVTIPVIPNLDAMEAANANFNCDPYNLNISGTKPCSGDYGMLRRLDNLEAAVRELQTKNAALEIKNGATGGNQTCTGLEARVSALETVTKAIQDSLVMVVNMLAQALSSLKH